MRVEKQVDVQFLGGLSLDESWLSAGSEDLLNYGKDWFVKVQDFGRTIEGSIRARFPLPQIPHIRHSGESLKAPYLLYTIGIGDGERILQTDRTGLTNSKRNVRKYDGRIEEDETWEIRDSTDKSILLQRLQRSKTFASDGFQIHNHTRQESAVFSDEDNTRLIIEVDMGHQRDGLKSEDSTYSWRAGDKEEIFQREHRVWQQYAGGFWEVAYEVERYGEITTQCKRDYIWDDSGDPVSIFFLGFVDEIGSLDMIFRDFDYLGKPMMVYVEYQNEIHMKTKRVWLDVIENPDDYSFKEDWDVRSFHIERMKQNSEETVEVGMYDGSNRLIERITHGNIRRNGNTFSQIIKKEDWEYRDGYVEYRMRDEEHDSQVREVTHPDGTKVQFYSDEFSRIITCIQRDTRVSLVNTINGLTTCRLIDEPPVYEAGDTGDRKEIVVHSWDDGVNSNYKIEFYLNDIDYLARGKDANIHYESERDTDKLDRQVLMT